MIWLCIVTLFSFVIKGLCGFANSMVFTTLLSFRNSIVHINPINLLLNYPSQLVLIWNYRKFIDYKICGPLCLTTLIGVIPGVIFFKNANISLLEIIFGAFVVIIALDMLFGRKKQTAARTQKSLRMTLLGVLSGFACGLCGIGVLVGAYISKVTDDTRVFKANASIVYFMTDTVKIVLYACMSILTVNILWESLLLLPVSLLGLWLGIIASKHMNEALVRKLVLIMLVLSGLALVVTNL